jgi:hypothetical protein
MVELLIFLLHMREASGSILGPETGNPDWRFFVVSFSPS